MRMRRLEMEHYADPRMRRRMMMMRGAMDPEDMCEQYPYYHDDYRFVKQFFDIRVWTVAVLFWWAP